MILTSYNHGPFIEESINSVISQTYGDWEMIVIDDNSEDDSWSRISRCEDDRVRIFRNSERSRAAKGLNWAIEQEARGEFIAIHHSGDAFRPMKLEKQVAFLERNKDCGAVFTDVDFVNERGLSVPSRHFYTDVFVTANRSRFDWLNRFFYLGNCLCHPSAMVRKTTFDAVGGYDRRLGQLTDFDMWIRICLTSEIHILNEKLTLFRLLENNANASARGPVNSIRMASELPVLLRSYLKIPPAYLFEVFPRANTWCRDTENFVVPYLVARVAIEHDKDPYRIFGLGVLYELLGCPPMARSIAEQHGFSFKDLIDLTPRVDVFGLRRLARLEKRDRLVTAPVRLLKRGLSKIPTRSSSS